MTHLHKTAQFRTRNWFFILRNGAPLHTDLRTWGEEINSKGITENHPVTFYNKRLFRARSFRQANRIADLLGEGSVERKIQLV